MQALITKQAAAPVVNKKASGPAPKGKKTTGAKLAPVKSEIKFAIQDYARPRSGAALIAHTAVFLSLSGLADGKAMPKAQAAKIIGARAVQYHLGIGNFAHTEKGIVLTEKGETFFVMRPADPELMAAYEQVMTTGKPSDLANVKTESSRIPV